MKVMDNQLLINLAKNLGYQRWLEEYAEVHHGLKGWLENDIYLDEVELPSELLHALIQRFLAEKYYTEVLAYSILLLKNGIEQEVKNFEYSYKIIYLGRTEVIPSSEIYTSYNEALQIGLYTALALVNNKTNNNK